MRFELAIMADDQETRISEITPMRLLRELKDNFNGIKRNEFEKLFKIFFAAVQEQCLDLKLPSMRRNVPTIRDKNQ